jgi:hypothetical protein
MENIQITYDVLLKRVVVVEESPQGLDTVFPTFQIELARNMPAVREFQLT